MNHTEPDDGVEQVPVAINLVEVFNRLAQVDDDFIRNINDACDRSRNAAFNPYCEHDEQEG